MREGLFFDLGDTLVDLRGLVPAMAAQLRGKFPALSSPSDIAVAWVTHTARDTHAAQGGGFRSGPVIAGDALVRSLRSAGTDIPVPESIRLVHAAWDDFLRGAKFHADASPELFMNLRSRVRAMGIVTDSDTSMVRPLLEKLNAYALFDVVVVSDTVGAYKPDPRIYRAALKTAGVSADSCVFVSDSLVDLQGCKGVGMEPVWIQRERRDARTPDPGGVTVISNLTELISLFPRGR